jgi:hypothetical protein
VSEDTVPLYLDEAIELARILELFDEYTTRGGQDVRAELSNIAYGDACATHLAYTEDTLTWAAGMTLRLKRAARTQAAMAIPANGETK